MHREGHCTVWACQDNSLSRPLTFLRTPEIRWRVNDARHCFILLLLLLSFPLPLFVIMLSSLNNVFKTLDSWGVTWLNVNLVHLTLLSDEGVILLFGTINCDFSLWQSFDSSHYVEYVTNSLKDWRLPPCVGKNRVSLLHFKSNYKSKCLLNCCCKNKSLYLYSLISTSLYLQYCHFCVIYPGYLLNSDSWPYKQITQAPVYQTQTQSDPRRSAWSPLWLSSVERSQFYYDPWCGTAATLGQLMRGKHIAQDALTN